MFAGDRAVKTDDKVVDIIGDVFQLFPVAGVGEVQAGIEMEVSGPGVPQHRRFCPVLLEYFPDAFYSGGELFGGDHHVFDKSGEPLAGHPVEDGGRRFANGP